MKKDTFSEFCLRHERLLVVLLLAVGFALRFAALGSILALLLPLTWKGRLVAASCGLLSGLMDETIQIFSDRGDQISDVWLDFAGALFGLVVFSLFRLLIRWIKLRRSR